MSQVLEHHGHGPTHLRLEKHHCILHVAELRQTLREPLFNDPHEGEMSASVPRAGQQYETLEIVYKHGEKFGLRVHLVDELVTQREEGGEESGIHLRAHHAGRERGRGGGGEEDGVLTPPNAHSPSLTHTHTCTHTHTHAHSTPTCLRLSEAPQT